MTPVFKPNGALIAIGGAVLYTVGGLNPQRVSFASEARFPGHAVPEGMIYQRTGLGMQTISIEAKTFPHVMGGLDAYAVLRAHHEAQAVVPFIRLRGNYLGQSSGLCVIETMEADEERLHPFDGVGRQVDVMLGLILMPANLSTIDPMRIAGFGGFLG